MFLQINRWRPQLQLHEKYQSYVKWGLHALTAIGILLNFFAFPWQLSVPISCAFVLLDKFLQASIFFHSSLYVHPIGFEFDSDKWESMAYVFFHDDKTGKPRFNAVGVVFTDATFAVRFFDFLKSWNAGSSEDREDHIKLSFVTDEDHYFVLIFPNLEKKSVKKFFGRAKRPKNASDYGKEHIGIEAFQRFRKSFDTMAGGYSLGEFVKRQKGEEWFYLAPLVRAPGGDPKLLHQDHWIKKWHFRAKNRFELDEQDWEYLLLRDV